jgi:hypothetical protein
MGNTWKNSHSAAGMGYSLHGTRYVNLKDCPACKYGTLEALKEDNWFCIDCKKEFTTQQLKILKKY